MEAYLAPTCPFRVFLAPAVAGRSIGCDKVMCVLEAVMLGKVILPTAVVVVVAWPLVHSLLISPYSSRPNNAGSGVFTSPGISHHSNCDTATITSLSAVPAQ